MATPQPGIFLEGNTAHRVHEYKISPSAEPPAIHAAVTNLGATITEQASGDAVQIVLGFGADLAEQLNLDTPTDFRSFESIGEGARTAPSTQHDLFVWFHGQGLDDIFDAALAARRAISGVAELASDTSAFVYHDSRDLTGFIDGTENPSADEGRDIAVVGEGLPGRGGSILLAQRWVHDLDAFHALSMAAQERVIGRTKSDSVELSEKELPDDAHISRVVMEDDRGDEIEIYRRSVPFAENTEAGLMFLGFSNELQKIDGMLHEMFGGADGTHDRLTDFSRAHSSSYYFVPCCETLHALGSGA